MSATGCARSGSTAFEPRVRRRIGPEVMPEASSQATAPNLKAIAAGFAPDPERLPQVCVQLAPLSVYEDLLGEVSGEAA